jgi:hypothetical protein
MWEVAAKKHSAFSIQPMNHSDRRRHLLRLGGKSLGVRKAEIMPDMGWLNAEC